MIKNVTIGSGVAQNKKSFWPIGQKMPILHEKLEFWMTRANFPLKKRGFWPLGQKDDNDARDNGNHTSP